MTRIRARAGKKGQSDIDLEYLKELWVDQQGRCPLTGWNMVLPVSTVGWAGGAIPESASLDRKNPKFGYVRGNVRFVALMANFAKHTFTDEDVRRFGEAVYRATNP